MKSHKFADLDAPDRPDCGQDAYARLQSAMSAERGALPTLAGEPFFNADGMMMTEHGFCFSTPQAIGFHYEVGGHLTIEAPAGASEEQIELYQWGTAYGAVSWLNSMVPLHASAIEFEDRAVGFTAPRGGGKSTLAAALCARGHPLICDDTLVLAPIARGFAALPDGKRMKLWSDAVGMLGLEPAAAIRAVPGKHFFEPSARAQEPSILRHLVFLQQGASARLDRVRGSAKLGLLAGSLYREELHLARRDHEAHTRMMLGLAEHIEVWILQRPIRPEFMQENNDTIYQLLGDQLF